MKTHCFGATPNALWLTFLQDSFCGKEYETTRMEEISAYPGELPEAGSLKTKMNFVTSLERLYDKQFPAERASAVVVKTTRFKSRKIMVMHEFKFGAWRAVVKGKIYWETPFLRETPLAETHDYRGTWFLPVMARLAITGRALHVWRIVFVDSSNSFALRAFLPPLGRKIVRKMELGPKVCYNVPPLFYSLVCTILRLLLQTWWRQVLDATAEGI